MKKFHIFGFGGFSREITGVISRLGYTVKCFVDKNNQESWRGIPVISENNKNYLELYPPKYALVGVGDSFLREKIVNNIIKKWPDCEFPNIIDPSCVFLVPGSIKLGIGVVMQPLCFVSSNVTIGDFCQVNTLTGIGHDTILEDYVTLAMGVNIAGDCNIGKKVRIGSGSTSREKINICNNVIIGVNSTIVKNISEEGTYVGTPAKKMEIKK